MYRKSKRMFSLAVALVATVLLVVSCKQHSSTTTGWNYNDPQKGGFEVAVDREQQTGPGLVFIEGGSFVMGRTEQDVMFDWNNIPRRVTVSSFYMDETEVRNIDYLEYLFWISRVFGASFPEVYRRALPDTLVWRDPLAFNEPFVQNYFRHPAYHEYPVVGVSWVQATEYAAWRTDRVNEMILIREGILDWDPDQVNERNFNTEAYLAGQYEGLVRRNMRDLDPRGTGERQVRWTDGILLPSFRLPTEAEWEFAALGLIGNTIDERMVGRRHYPWEGNTVRSDDRRTMGIFMSNFQRRAGDYMGIAGNLNDGGEGPVPVLAYWPNDYGLYNMAGNVNEWVLDVYRPLSHEVVTDLRPFRGNVFETLELDAEGRPVPKDEFGRLRTRPADVDPTRRNYRQADNINLRDGDVRSSIFFAEEDPDTASVMYEHNVTTLINNEARVFKGGSWRDRAYWLVPGNRRFLDQNEATNDIGFRCAMVRVGSPVGN
ncbi:MAG TPA: SUMF1/EgtB/PvdO family nonheme iron enzyme [Bacteroidales bacterium]|nr:SUMF1/EgtB/PvdO family nonheme iron enzyme [Bacteroidales bacterium]